MSASELETVRRFYTAHRNHFALGLVRCNSPLETRRNLQDLGAQGTRVALVDFAGRDDRLLDALRGRASDHEGIAVVGVDELLLRDDGWIGQLNVEREAIRAAVPLPVTIWAGDAAMDRLFDLAPDFADWHSVVFRMESPLEVMESAVSEPTSAEGQLTGEALDRRIELLRGIKKRMDEDPATDKARRAAVDLELGSLLGSRGFIQELDEALLSAQEAVAIFRDLTKEKPDAYLPDLASALNNLGNILGDLGRVEDALQAAEDGVEIRRKLAAARPDAYLPDLAMSLNNWGIRLIAVGHGEDALRAAEEAVGIYRKLAAARPDSYLPALATSLNNLGNWLSAVGRAEDALRAAEEAVGIYRKLAGVRPDAFGADLARSLAVVSMCLTQLGRFAEAVEHGREAVSTLRPRFLRNRNGYAGVMDAVIDLYRQACEAAGVEPEESLD
ncbi:MAG: tetratricopeptide repeat protein [Bryobacteraceae bacterium]